MFNYESIVQNLLEGGILEFLDMVEDGIILAQVHAGGTMPSAECVATLAHILTDGPQEISFTIKESPRNSITLYDGEVAVTARRAEIQYWVHHQRPWQGDPRSPRKYSWVERLACGEYHLYKGGPLPLCSNNNYYSDSNSYPEMVEAFLTILMIDYQGELTITLMWQGGCKLQPPELSSHSEEVTPDDIPF